MRKILLTLVGVAVSLACEAKVTLPSVYGDNMVLQQQSEARLRGWATPNRRVTITASWSKRAKVTATADSLGRWSAALPTPEAGGPYTLTFDDGEKLILKNILLGEVWLCSGQSNMEMPMKGFYNQPVEGASRAIMAAKPSTPIRICRVARNFTRTVQEDCKAAWYEHTPEEVAETSATAYYFALALQERLGVPVGIITTSWGGTPVQAWMDQKSASQFKELRLGHLKQDLKLKHHENRPCLLYNAMIAPLLPYTIKGFLWYQGEANRKNPALYRRLMPAFVKMLRERWGLGEIPFYYVQIAPYRYEESNGRSTALLREVQMQNLKEIPNSDMAVTLDLGDEGCIHPAKKQEVGERLAWLALYKTYGVKGIIPYTPIYESMKVVNGKARLTFQMDNMGLAPLGRELTGFEVAGSDRVFHPATGVVQGKSVIITCKAVKEPVAVRYAFRNYTEATLFNNYGIPVSSFRTDDWEVE